MIAMSNQYHFNGVLSQEYDAPLFQLTVEDVMKNVFLKEAMVPYDWFHMEEEIGHGKQITSFYLDDCNNITDGIDKLYVNEHDFPIMTLLILSYFWKYLLASKALQLLRPKHSHSISVEKISYISLF